MPRIECTVCGEPGTRTVKRERISGVLCNVEYVIHEISKKPRRFKWHRQGVTIYDR